MTVYLDMDGVIADFFGKLEDNYNVDHWKSIKNITKTLADIACTDFFYQIEPFPETGQIIALVESLSDGDWGICSSPLRGEEYNSAYWKRKWLEDLGCMPTDLEKLIFTHEKHLWAIDRITGKPNVLIDDKPSNVNEWINAGGIGILFQCNKDDVEWLEDVLLSYV